MKEKRTCVCGVKYYTGPLPGGGYQPYKCNCVCKPPPKER